MTEPRPVHHYIHRDDAMDAEAALCDACATRQRYADWYQGTTLYQRCEECGAMPVLDIPLYHTIIGTEVHALCADHALEALTTQHARLHEPQAYIAEQYNLGTVCFRCHN